MCLFTEMPEVSEISAPEYLNNAVSCWLAGVHLAAYATPCAGPRLCFDLPDAHGEQASAYRVKRVDGRSRVAVVAADEQWTHRFPRAQWSIRPAALAWCSL